MSEKFLSSNGDGYYFVKLIDKTETQVNYESLKVAFTTFNEQIEDLYEAGGVTEFITLDANTK